MLSEFRLTLVALLPCFLLDVVKFMSLLQGYYFKTIPLEMSDQNWTKTKGA